jgi:hypothetical protein
MWIWWHAVVQLSQPSLSGTDGNSNHNSENISKKKKRDQNRRPFQQTCFFVAWCGSKPNKTKGKTELYSVYATNILKWKVLYMLIIHNSVQNYRQILHKKVVYEYIKFQNLKMTSLTLHFTVTKTKCFQDLSYIQEKLIWKTTSSVFENKMKR